MISAPAGFGKTRLVEGFTADRPPLATIVFDCREPGDFQDFTDSVRFALLERTRGRAPRQGASSAAEAEALLFELWRSASGPRTIVFDHAEALLDDPERHGLIDRLLAIPQRTRTVVVSSRRAVSLPGASFALPHETVTVGPDDLRLDVAEIRALLEPAGAGGEADAVTALSAGWPEAVLFLRTCAQEGSLRDVLNDPAGPGAARFHNYVEREVVETADPSERAVAFACAALFSAADADLRSFLGSEIAARGVTSLARQRLLQRRDNGECTLHPLLAATLRALHGRELAAIIERVASSFAETAPLRAAPLLATIGDLRAAESAYAHTRIEAADQVDFESSLRAAQIDREALLDNLALFNAATTADYYGIAIEDWIAQAQEALRRAGDAPEGTRAVTVLLLTIRFALVGRWDEGHAFLAVERARLPAGDAVAEGRFLLLGALLDAAADRPVDVPALRKRLGGDVAVGYLRALFARRVASTVSALHGRAAEVMREFEIAYTRVEASGRTPYVVELAMLACFEAWRAGDDETARRWYERASVAVDHRTASGAKLFLDAFRGGASIGFQESETPVTRAHASLIAASLETDAAQALRWLDAALQAALRTRRPLTIVLVRVAIASVDPDAAAEQLRLARDLAAGTPSVALLAAVDAIAKGERDLGMLGPFVERFSRISVPKSADLELGLIDGTIRWRGTPVDLEDRPFFVLCLLALAGGPLHQDHVTEALWPDRPVKEMANALRVHLSAIRRALAKDAIVHDRGRYRLACSYRLDVHVYEAVVRSAQMRDVLRDVDRRALREGLGALERYHARMPHFELVSGLAERLAGLRARILQLLGDDALLGERFDDALDYARAAQELDPYDDRSMELLVTALSRSGRPTAAARAVQEHEERVRRDLGVEPSTILRELISLAIEPNSTSARSRSA
ncbi:MAG TPA: BTAD domain-containing putative transcriptional regulator [Candidatus Acidoferrum sp.]|nr:BTAD domain-containing putative transcriptional regulator [Candidatus Acidoferrum sp.]